MKNDGLWPGTYLLVLLISTSCRGQSDEVVMCELDSAVSPFAPLARRATAFEKRSNAAQAELDLRHHCHNNNGDEEKYPSLIGNFHKTLPHNKYGEVDIEAYDALLHCLSSGDFSECDNIPGGPTKLANPLGGLTFQMRGPDPQAIVMRPPPSLESAQLAAQMAEVYWMSLLRDVPFSEYGTNELAKKAAENLAEMPGYFGYGRPVNSDGSVDPASQLFRTSFPGVTKGPHVSQGNFGDVASYLVEKGAHANDVYVDEDGDRHSLLMDAIIVENVAFAELLISHGADVTVKDEQGVTTLIQAAHRGMDHICELLLSKGVDATGKSDDGITALIAAASEGHTDIVASLLKGAGANPDDKDKDGTTALMAASVRGHQEVVGVLLDHGADLNLQNDEGHTALMFAYNGRNQVAELLWKYSEYIQGKEDTQAKVIQDALQVHTDIVKALMSKGADASMVDKDGYSALDFDYQGRLDNTVIDSSEGEPPKPPPERHNVGGAGTSSASSPVMGQMEL